MTNKNISLFAIACILVANFSYSNQCDNFYAKVTYSLSHTKKALGATNFEHQMYYAERALTALEKSESFMADCGCEKSTDKRLDAMEALNKAIEPVDWDAGRYFSKKSMGLINELITILDECTLGITPEIVVEDSADTTLEHEAYAEPDESEASMEQEMIKVFNKHATDKLQATEKAVSQLVQFSKTIQQSTSENTEDPNTLGHHQKTYLENARKLLLDALEELESEN
ncbi:hypothetical protein [Flagellimonas myxillae]|uniref:hypothetical protein n=1 Tax=Flagellimonas myxillae TaxID=2942214 RepID=UPI00201F037B|nr:hypothetical protein [Muricauda myxillae]MCL6266119.1 hypothetical protein [Muricauda myxillae]